ncbi:MAG: NADH-quinone oxidoreductase subunit C [Bacteroidota bacterium]|jgi:NADH-quinone oxidoreductase subunit C
MELSEVLERVIDDLKNTFSDQILDVTQFKDDVTVIVDKEATHEVCKRLKNEHHFIYLVDMLGADRFTSEDRFELIYNMMSLRDQQRLFVKTRLPEENPTIPSVSDIWTNANWHEREAYDMYGIKFDNHPDMRRIFMPEDFDYFPLRKEFPLLGIPGSIELPSSTPDTD